ncbi:hypothetical protein [Novosphingobium sp.]|uniref:hypothetical protein n=1 Tax=Novosphingobium sp. TaxID=1874826 RepID=UPI001DC9E76E|nr:hypothetical protein [Novosphingobium sp.]MBX9662829.1 hypothetical protein [Novosphingobium sp.]
MAWTAALASVPWAKVLEQAPKLARSASSLVRSIRGPQNAKALVTTANGDGDDVARLARIETDILKNGENISQIAGLIEELTASHTAAAQRVAIHQKWLISLTALLGVSVALNILALIRAA